MKATGAWGAALGAVTLYTVSALTTFLPAPRFLPRLGVWRFDSIPGEPDIRWYGWMGYALVGAIVGMGAARLLARRLSWHWLWVLAAASLLLLTWHEHSWFR